MTVTNTLEEVQLQPAFMTFNISFFFLLLRQAPPPRILRKSEEQPSLYKKVQKYPFGVGTGAIVTAKHLHG